MPEHIESRNCQCWGCVSYAMRTVRYTPITAGMISAMQAPSPAWQCQVRDCDEVTDVGVYVCDGCVQVMHDEIQQAPALYGPLLQIARGLESPAGSRNRVKHTGTQRVEPVNLGILDLVEQLKQIYVQLSTDLSLPYLRRDPEAGAKIRAARAAITRASELVYGGEPEQLRSPEQVRAMLSVLPAMGAAEAAAYLSDRGVAVTARMIYHWADRGRLVPADTSGRARYRVLDIYQCYESRYRRESSIIAQLDPATGQAAYDQV